jgi:hypothetical protein
MPSRCVQGILAKISLLAFPALLVLYLGCGEAKPPSPQAQAFRQQVKSVLSRLADPLAGPVSQENPEAIQKVLVRLFHLCAAECDDLVSRMVVLDRDGLTISFYPPKDNPEWRFADYEVVRKAMATRKPAQGILYQPDSTAIYVISAPLVTENQVRGVMVLIMEREKVRIQKGLQEEEFLQMNFSD